MVTEPRLPCYKLGIKSGWKDIIKRCLASRRTGFYLAVIREGTVEAGDPIELIERDRQGVTVADITYCMRSTKTIGRCWIAQCKSRPYTKAGGDTSKIGSLVFKPSR